MSQIAQYSTDPSALIAEEEEIAELPEGDEDEAMGEEVVEDQGYASSTPTSSLTWISWFCSLPGHEYFCEVTEDFIEDDFNLTGLNALVPFWKEAMEMVLDVEPEDAKIPDVSIVESSAELLYGLVHQRYILTRPGLQAMVEKYEAGHFGICPRVYCNSCHVAPCGRSDLPGLDTVKLYCPNCNDIYTPPSSRYQGVDGAFFGTTFAPLMFQTYREIAPASFCPPLPGPSLHGSPHSSNGSPIGQGGSGEEAGEFENPHPHGGQKRPSGQVYIPKLFGFRVSEKARSGPRMKWLRLRPETLEEIDQVDWRGQWKIDDHDHGDEDDADGGDGPLENFDDDLLDEEGEEEEEEEEEEAAPPPPPPPKRGATRGQTKGKPLGSSSSDHVIPPPAFRALSESILSTSIVTPSNEAFDTQTSAPIDVHVFTKGEKSAFSTFSKDKVVLDWLAMPSARAVPV